MFKRLTGKRIEEITIPQRAEFFEIVPYDISDKKLNNFFFVTCLWSYYDKKPKDEDEEIKRVKIEEILRRKYKDETTSESAKKRIILVMRSNVSDGNMIKNLWRILSQCEIKNMKIDYLALLNDLNNWDYDGGVNYTRNRWLRHIVSQK
jgi:hypothetical protein